MEINLFNYKKSIIEDSQVQDNNLYWLVRNDTTKIIKIISSLSNTALDLKIPNWFIFESVLKGDLMQDNEYSIVLSQKEKSSLIPFVKEGLINFEEIKNLSEIPAVSFASLIFNIFLETQQCEFSLFRANSIYIGYNLQLIGKDEDNNSISNLTNIKLSDYRNNKLNISLISDKVIDRFKSNLNKENKNISCILNGTPVNEINSNILCKVIPLSYSSITELILPKVSNLIKSFGSIIVNKDSITLSSQYNQISRMYFHPYSNIDILYCMKIKYYLFIRNIILKNDTYFFVHGLIETMYNKYKNLSMQDNIIDNKDTNNIIYSQLIDEVLDVIYNIIGLDIVKVFYEKYNKNLSHDEQINIKDISISKDSNSSFESFHSENKENIENNHNNQDKEAVFNSDILISNFTTTLNDLISMFNNSKDVLIQILKTIFICLYLKELVFEEDKEGKVLLLTNNNLDTYSNLFYNNKTNNIKMDNNYKFIQKISVLMEIDPKTLLKNLVSKEIKSPNGSFYIVRYNKEEAYLNKNNLIKFIYEQLFDFIVKLSNICINNKINEINLCTHPKNKEETEEIIKIIEKALKSHSYLSTPSIIDNWFFQIVEIKGHDFKNDNRENGLSELFVNYTNDKIQQLLYDKLIKKETEVYVKEGIKYKCSNNNYNSNSSSKSIGSSSDNNFNNCQNAIKQCEDKICGIFKLIDTQSGLIDKGNFKALVTNINKNWNTNVQHSFFTIDHLVKSVEYGDENITYENVETITDDWKSAIYSNIFSNLGNISLSNFKFSSKVKATLKQHNSTLLSFIMKREKFIDYFFGKELKDYIIDQNSINQNKNINTKKDSYSKIKLLNPKRMSNSIKLKSMVQKFNRTISKLLSYITNSSLELIKLLKLEDTLTYDEKLTSIFNQLSDSSIYESILLEKNGYFIKESIDNIVNIINSSFFNKYFIHSVDMDGLVDKETLKQELSKFSNIPIESIEIGKTQVMICNNILNNYPILKQVNSLSKYFTFIKLRKIFLFAYKIKSLINPLYSYFANNSKCNGYSNDNIEKLQTLLVSLLNKRYSEVLNLIVDSLQNKIIFSIVDKIRVSIVNRVRNNMFTDISLLFNNSKLVKFNSIIENKFDIKYNHYKEFFFFYLKFTRFVNKLSSANIKYYLVFSFKFITILNRRKLTKINMIQKFIRKYLKIKIKKSQGYSIISKILHNSFSSQLKVIFNTIHLQYLESIRDNLKILFFKYYKSSFKRVFKEIKIKLEKISLIQFQYKKRILYNKMKTTFLLNNYFVLYKKSISKYRKELLSWLLKYKKASIKIVNEKQISNKKVINAASNNSKQSKSNNQIKKKPIQKVNKNDFLNDFEEEMNLLNKEIEEDIKILNNLEKINEESQVSKLQQNKSTTIKKGLPYLKK